MVMNTHRDYNPADISAGNTVSGPISNPVRMRKTRMYRQWLC